MALFENLSAHTSSIAVVNESGSLITYDELASTADLIAEFTPERNLIFSFCQNKFECLAGYVGFLRGDCVQLLLQPDVDNLLLLNLIQTYKPKYLFAPISYFSKLPKGKILWKGADYQLLQINNLVDYEMHQDLALLMTTSGTTGSTKLVRLTYENIRSNAVAIINYLQIRSTDRAITTMPMSYVYGLSIVNTHLLAGASLVITESTLVERNFWNLLQSTRTTTFGGVPYLYTVLEKLRFEQMVLPSLRVLTQAGGKLNLELRKKFFAVCQEKGIQLILMYGQTEATGRIAYIPWDKREIYRGTVGVAIPGGRLTLEDENGKEVTSAHQAGELIYRGSNVSMGYAENRGDLIKGDCNRGMLKTGDVGKLASNGSFSIIGRKSRIIKIHGARVNLDELEELLLSQKIECACIGVDDVLQVFLKKPSVEKRAAKILFDRVRIRPASCQFRQVEEIPRGQSGKTLYSRLHELGS